MKSATMLIVVSAAAAMLTHAPARAAAPVPAMRAIAIAEDQRRLGEIAGFLKNPAPTVRARAALATGRLQDSTSVAALLPLLKDTDVRVRREAAFALGQIGHRSARAALERSLTDADGEVADLSLEALGKLGDKAATPQVVARLGAKSALLRGDAAIALWRLADKSALGSLLAHLDDPVADVRWKVVYALEKLDDARRIGPAVAPLLRDPDALVQAHAARTLGRVHAQGVTSALVQALQSRNDALVVNALRALQLIADSTDTSTLGAIARLLAHYNPHVRVTAATALGDHFAWWPAVTGDEANATSVLALATTDYDAATRGAAARSLIARLGIDGWERFSPMLEDSSVYVRVAVLDGIRQMDAAVVAGHAQPLADALFASMRDVRPRFERMTAAEVAGTLLGRAQGKPHLHTFDGLLARLQALVDDPDVLIAASAAGALGDANDRPSVRHLVSAYAARGKDADADARIGIRDALRALAGRAFADSIERTYPAPAPPARYDAGWEKPPAETRAVLTTSAGVIEWRFLGAEAPQTVRNFITLATKGYFNGLRVHRVVPDFVIQDGDPTGTGSGGPGYSIRCEYNHQRYDAGQVGMALSGKDTGGSQWFITLAPQPHLNGKYTIFAAITQGLDVARRITQGDIIQRVEILP